MALQTISIRLSAPAGERQLVLALDDTQMSQRIMLEEFAQGRLYEAETSNFLGSVLAPGDTFIDIGAHVGYFSMLAAALVGPAGRVWAFEPEPTNFAHLLHHASLNGATHLVPMHMAAGAAPAVAEFFLNADNDGGHALWDVGQHPFNQRSRQAPRRLPVFVTSLDSLFALNPPATLKVIKIDAEGAEGAVLRGARELLLRTRVPFVIAEINRFALQSMGTSEQEVRAFASALGYETWLFNPGQASLLRLEPDQTPDTNYVFNLLFRHPSAPVPAGLA